MENDLFRGEFARLAALEPADAQVIANWTRDAEYLRLMEATPAHPKSPGEVEAYIEQVQEADNGFIFAVRTLSDDRLVGYLEFDGILWNQGVSGIALAIGNPADQGKGYGTDALRLGVRYAFDELNLRRLQLTVFEYNARAISLYEKLGFRHEGTFREFLCRDGSTHDMYLYGLLRREWRTEANPC